MLDQTPGALRSRLVYTFETKRRDIGEPGDHWHWHPGELQRFFELALPEVLKTRAVWPCVDALDECGKDNAIELIHTFESLCSRAFCLALHVERALEISPEHENRHDISIFVNDRLDKFDARTSLGIPNLITDRASGVFLWAYLVVKRVLDLEREGVGLKRIEAAVRAVPPELEDLYNELIRSMEPASLKLIQWICFATRPLTLSELRWAMAVEVNCPYGTLQECEGADEYVSDVDWICRYQYQGSQQHVTVVVGY
ncbi:hypothetical protein B0H67DRAFT_683183 [Lasiosphaeris hirsuta]|uniref:Uncharacterized protein n=1 Tax=Lasiosphaeris hirsuta TaxID=260670 RepID=A0AA40AFB8_9PEZI|nr:hypothetical protein B0H67DRAFT_683183 [Lasiosphaeris hirsuta]